MSVAGFVVLTVAAVSTFLMESFIMASQVNPGGAGDLPDTVGGWTVLGIAIAISGYLARRWAQDSDATDKALAAEREAHAQTRTELATAVTAQAVAETKYAELVLAHQAQSGEIESLRSQLSDKYVVERELAVLKARLAAYEKIRDQNGHTGPAHPLD